MAASERDPTGAGDVFGAALTVGLWRGSSPMDAAREAAYAAARAVEGPGLGNLR
jgi:1D-myo-inositol 3-kinase